MLRAIRWCCRYGVAIVASSRGWRVRRLPRPFDDLSLRSEIRTRDRAPAALAWHGPCSTSWRVNETYVKVRGHGSGRSRLQDAEDGLCDDQRLRQDARASQGAGLGLQPDPGHLRRGPASSSAFGLGASALAERRSCLTSGSSPKRLDRPTRPSTPTFGRPRPNRAVS